MRPVTRGLPDRPAEPGERSERKPGVVTPRDGFHEMKEKGRRKRRSDEGRDLNPEPDYDHEHEQDDDADSYVRPNQCFVCGLIQKISSGMVAGRRQTEVRPRQMRTRS